MVPPRAQRVDARQNRESILAAALEALTGAGTISMNAIAIRAGVGNATLYRNFPTSEALVLAVYRREVEQVAEAPQHLLDTNSPARALNLWILQLAQYAMTKQGLADALRVATHSESELFEETYKPIVGALALLLEKAADAGTVMSGLDPDDVLLAFAGLWQLNPAGDWAAQAQRLYELVIDGLRPR